MKKNLFILLVTMIVFSSCNSEKKYQENMRTTIYMMAEIMVESMEQTEKIVNIWETAIYENKYNGKYCRDFNDALQDFIPKIMDEPMVRKKLIDDVNNIDVKMQELKKFPSKYKEAFYEMAELAPLVKKIAENVKAPSGSLLTYGEKQAELSNEIMNRIDVIILKYL